MDIIELGEDRKQRVKKRQLSATVFTSENQIGIVAQQLKCNQNRSQSGLTECKNVHVKSDQCPKKLVS